MINIEAPVNSAPTNVRDRGIPHYDQHVFEPNEVENDKLAQIFTPQQMLGLARIRHEVENGQRTDLTPEQKRLNFAAWLYDNGIIKS